MTINRFDRDNVSIIMRDFYEEMNPNNYGELWLI